MLTTATTIILWSFIKAAFPFYMIFKMPIQKQPILERYFIAFTTKLAIYALARGFAGFGCDSVGCVMTAFPIFFAVMRMIYVKCWHTHLIISLDLVVGIGIRSCLLMVPVPMHLLILFIKDFSLCRWALFCIVLVPQKPPSLVAYIVRCHLRLYFVFLEVCRYLPSHSSLVLPRNL